MDFFPDSDSAADFSDNDGDLVSSEVAGVPSGDSDSEQVLAPLSRKPRLMDYLQYI